MTKIELTKRLNFLEGEVERHQKSIDTLEKVISYVGDEVEVTIHVTKNNQDDPIHFVKAGGLIYLIRKEKEHIQNEIKKTLDEYSSNLNE